MENPVTRTKRVAVIGGGPAGMRAAIVCAQLVHYKASVEDVLKEEKNLSAITHAATTEITDDGVWYQDQAGEKHFVPADDVVLSGGVKPRQAEAMALAGTAPEFYVIGDAKKSGDIKSCTRSAYSIATLI